MHERILVGAFRMPRYAGRSQECFPTRGRSVGTFGDHKAVADFAFLSACQTAMGYDNHSDEAVHLAAGMLFAGYCSVVAAMWPISDSDVPFVADEAYSQLLKDEHPNSAMAAQALHQAVQSLRREKYGNGSFAAWVPFIHVGMGWTVLES